MTIDAGWLLGALADREGRAPCMTTVRTLLVTVDEITLTEAASTFSVWTELTAVATVRGSGHLRGLPLFTRMAALKRSKGHAIQAWHPRV
jgi:hypothetical protein